MIGMPGRHNHWRLYLAAAHAQLDNIVFFQAHLRQRRTGNNRRIVPAQVRHRLGQFLQPAHVRPASVINIRIGPEDNLHRIFRSRRGNRSMEKPHPRWSSSSHRTSFHRSSPDAGALRQPVSKSPLIVGRHVSRTRLIRNSAKARSAVTETRRARFFRHTADRSAAAPPTPCRHTPAHPTTTPAHAPRGYANAQICPVSSRFELR